MYKSETNRPIKVVRTLKKFLQAKTPTLRVEAKDLKKEIQNTEWKVLFGISEKPKNNTKKVYDLPKGSNHLISLG